MYTSPVGIIATGLNSARNVNVGYVSWTKEQKCRLYWCLIVYRPEIQLVMLVLSTPLVNCCHSTFSLTSPTPPPFPKETYSIYRQCVAVGGGGGLSCVVDHILKEFKALSSLRL
jgi:hypothetical protein